MIVKVKCVKSMSNDFQTITAEAAGIPSAAVGAFIDQLEHKTLPMHSIVLLKGEGIAAEAYWKPFDEGFRHRVYSTSKSFVSVAVGILAGDGKLSLDDRVADFFPDYAAKHAPVQPYAALATIRDLLMTTTCFNTAAYAAFNDWTAAYFQLPAQHMRGQSFRYDTLATVMLGMIIRRVSGVEFMSLCRSACLIRPGCRLISSASRHLGDPGIDLCLPSKMLRHMLVVCLALYGEVDISCQDADKVPIALTQIVQVRRIS